MDFMKNIIRFIFVFLILEIGFAAYGKGAEAISVSSGVEQRLKEKAVEAKVYCVEKGFDINYCFLVDFSIHSGKYRFLYGILKEIQRSVQVFARMDMV
ncbi:hypothetical protein KGMB02408_31140 [Bacteroides faecalis]|uniref:Uncharacterized protein n=1 Tax=Bacteroides faecalis TaxID=2447885 RepID=A0A401LXD2_9BACE|nr:hypothetical protein KGMB02408_31140 [Bacteroides faecalis]